MRVEPILYLLDVFIRYLVKVRSFWEVPPHRAVGVLVQPTFPGMKRSGEEEFCVECFRHTNVVRELFAQASVAQARGIGTRESPSSISVWTNTEGFLTSASQDAHILLPGGIDNGLVIA